MRLGQAIYNGASFLVVSRGDEVVLPALSESWDRGLSSCQAVIEGGASAWQKLDQFCSDAPSSCRMPMRQIRLMAPLPRPRKNIICLGWNYADHAEESAQATGKKIEIPEHPIIFTKAVTAVAGPEDDIEVDATVTSQLDWEVELGVVIGSTAKNVDERDALSRVFAYTVINDTSARDLQFRHKQYFMGKSLDKASPIGPWLVTADELGDPQQLDLRSWVNGELKQSSNTRHQVFDVAKIISLLSRVMTLEPGDIIATGTPSGVGFARQPPEFLAPGDIVECEVEKIGRLRNRIVAARRR